MTGTIFDLAHEVTFVAYTAFAILVVFRGSRSWLGALLFAAVAATALWAQTRVAVVSDLLPLWLDPLTNSLRDAAWLGLCLALMHRRGGHTVLWRALMALAAVLIAFQSVLDVTHVDAGVVAGVHIDGALLRVAVTILGLVLVENIFRNSSPAEFWALKHLLIGLLCILTFQLLPGYRNSSPIARIPTWQLRGRWFSCSHCRSLS